jgi:transcriptional regulator with XRE-family HTH domain
MQSIDCVDIFVGVMGAKSRADLARKLGVARCTVSGWSADGVIPAWAGLTAILDFGVDPNALRGIVTGAGLSRPYR